MFDDILKRDKEEKHIKCCQLCGSDNIKTEKKIGLILVSCSDCNLLYFTEL